MFVCAPLDETPTPTPCDYGKEDKPVEATTSFSVEARAVTESRGAKGEARSRRTVSYAFASQSPREFGKERSDDGQIL